MEEREEGRSGKRLAGNLQPIIPGTGECTGLGNPGCGVLPKNLPRCRGRTKHPPVGRTQHREALHGPPCCPWWLSVKPPKIPIPNVNHAVGVGSWRVWRDAPAGWTARLGSQVNQV